MKKSLIQILQLALIAIPFLAPLHSEAGLVRINSGTYHSEEGGCSVHVSQSGDMKTLTVKPARMQDNSCQKLATTTWKWDGRAFRGGPKATLFLFNSTSFTLKIVKPRDIVSIGRYSFSQKELNASVACNEANLGRVCRIENADRSTRKGSCSISRTSRHDNPLFICED